ncbi:MAG: 50S ribosomal protein L18 [Nitrososphaeria archaeon]
MREKYVEVYRRRRKGKTDYRLRKRLVVSRLPFVSIRISNKNVLVQLVKAGPNGDTILGSIFSKQLQKLGWPFSKKSLPACYLCGLMLGSKMKDKVNSKVVIYMGVKPYITGSRASAVIKGLIDGGLMVEAGRETFPEEKRLNGSQIASYAKNLKSSDPDLYNRRFSNYIREGLNVEEMPIIFEKVKKTIIERKGVVE